MASSKRAGTIDPASGPPLMRNPRFILLWLSSSASFVALPTYLLFEQWYVVDALEAGGALSAVLVATTLPRALLMIFGGVVSDRFQRSRVAALSALGRCLAVLVMSFVLHAGALSLEIVLVFAVAYGIFDAFFSPAVNSMAPQLVTTEKLTSANAFLQGVNQVGMVLGPLIGAVLISISYELTLGVVGVMLFVSAVSAALIREPPDRESAGHRAERRSSAWVEIKQGVAYLLSSAGLRESLMLIVVVNFFFFAPVLIGVPLLVSQGLGQGVSDLAWLQGGYAAGMIAGALTVPVLRIRDHLRFTRGLLVALGILVAGLGLVSAVWTGVGVMGVMGVISSMINVLLITRIQQNSDKSMLGRIMAIVSVVSSGLVPVSYALFGIVVGIGVGVRLLIIICGGVIVLASFGSFIIARQTRVSATAASSNEGKS